MPKNSRKLYTLVIFIFLSILLGAILNSIAPDLPIISDSKHYLEIAQSLKDNKKYITISEKEIVIPPIYPIFLSFFTINDANKLDPIYFAQVILVGIIAGIVFLLAENIKHNRIFSWSAGLSTLFWPYALLYSQMIYTEIMYMLLLYVAIYTFSRAIKKEGNQLNYWSIISGACFALATLTRAVTLLLPIGLLIFMLVRSLWNKNQSKRVLKSTFLIATICYVLIIPWQIFVFHSFGKIVPVSSFGAVFEKGNQTLSYLDTNGEIDEMGSKADFQTWATAKFRNVYLFWDPGASGYHADIIKNKTFLAGPAIIVYKIIFIALVAIFILGIPFYHRNLTTWTSLCVILYTWSIHVVLFPFPRYTFPIMPLVIILALFTLSNIKFKNQNIQELTYRFILSKLYQSKRIDK